MAEVAGPIWTFLSRPWLRPLGVFLAALPLLACAAVLPACDEETGSDVQKVTIGGEPFFLELAMDDPTRMKGLGGRDFIADDGGMLFVFPDGFGGVKAFVMRDCPIPIDIMYLDGAGRVVSTYTMQPEEPQGENETEAAYNERLKRYSSRFGSQFVIELKAGTIDRLGVKEGDVIKFDYQGLKERAE